MIDYLETLTESVRKTLWEQRIYGKDSTLCFRSYMKANIMLDLLEWAYWKRDALILKGLDITEVDQAIERLNSCLENLVTKCKSFQIRRIRESLQYTNVNTPLNPGDWNTVANINHFSDIIDKSQESVWIPDGNYQPKIVFTVSNPTGISTDKMTTHEKMDVYIDRTTGIAYYVDLQGQWQRVNSAGLDESQVMDLIEENRGKIKHNINDTSITTTIEDTEDNVLHVADENDVKNLL